MCMAKNQDSTGKIYGFILGAGGEERFVQMDKNSENKLQTIIKSKIEPAIIAALFPKNLVLTNCIWVAV